MKLKLKGRRLDTLDEIQTESKAVSDSFQEKNLGCASLRLWTGDGIIVYFPNWTISKVASSDFKTQNLLERKKRKVACLVQCIL